VIKLTDAMRDADFVVVDGVMFETEYLRVPDEYTVADDVVLERSPSPVTTSTLPCGSARAPTG